MITEKIPGVFLGKDAQEAIDTISDILNGNR